MSWIGSDDNPICDLCDVMYPPGWPDGWIAPWPSSGHRWENGRVPNDERNTFHVCRNCMQDLIMRSSLRRDARTLARENQARWRARQMLIAEAEAIASGRAV
jgi:hypothetical protein